MTSWLVAATREAAREHSAARWLKLESVICSYVRQCSSQEFSCYSFSARQHTARKNTGRCLTDISLEYEVLRCGGRHRLLSYSIAQLVFSYLQSWSRGSETFLRGLSVGAQAVWVHQRAAHRTPARKAPHPYSRKVERCTHKEQGQWRIINICREIMLFSVWTNLRGKNMIVT